MPVNNLLKGNAVKSLIASVAKPFVRLAYASKKNSLTAFVFHEVADHPEGFLKERDLTVSVANFQRQILWVQKNFNIIHPDALLQKSKLPPRAALITFDDGYVDAFENGIRFLIDHKIPSLMFLNMSAVTMGKPLLSVVANYLEKSDSVFTSFASEIKLQPPFHLTLNPEVLNRYEQRYGALNIDSILAYQGRIINTDGLRRYADEKLLVLGNHLFEHWNARALSAAEFAEQYRKNEVELANFSNTGPFFAFTNGQPGSCFSGEEIAQLQMFGAAAIFSSAGSVNLDMRKKNVIDRISFRDTDDADLMWLRIAYGLFKAKKSTV